MQRSKIMVTLPKPVREALDKRLVSGAFSDYRGLATWLREQGYNISKSSLNRYAKGYERRTQAVMMATAQARALALAAPDAEGAMTDALCRLIQERLFGLLIETDALPDAELPKIARAISDLGRAAISQKRWREEMADRLAHQKRQAETTLAAEAEHRGLSPETVQIMRNLLIGIDPLDDRSRRQVQQPAQEAR
jgi:Protein of unknown function (DUF3486)